MSFFRDFPTSSYDFGVLADNRSIPRLDRSRHAGGVKTEITDIFRSASVLDHLKIINNSIYYEYYKIIDGDRPDIVSNILYKNPEYDWSFFILNNSLKGGLPSWPMSQLQLENYLTTEYDSYGVLDMTEEIILTNVQYLDNKGENPYPDQKTSDKTWWLHPEEMLARKNLDNPGWTYHLANSQVNRLSAVSGIDFVYPNMRLREILNKDGTASGALAEIMKYDPDLQQIWIKKGSVGIVSVNYAKIPQLFIPKYVRPPRATVSGGNGVGCKIEPLLSIDPGAKGIITKFRLVAGGTNYISKPDGGDPLIVTISEAPSIPSTLNVYADSVTGNASIKILSPGAGYCRAPKLEITRLVEKTSAPVLNAIVALTATALISGTSTMTLNGIYSNIYPRSNVFGPSIPPETHVTNVVTEIQNNIDVTVITLSKPVTAGVAASASIIFTPETSSSNINQVAGSKYISVTAWLDEKIEVGDIVTGPGLSNLAGTVRVKTIGKNEEKEFFNGKTVDRAADPNANFTKARVIRIPYDASVKVDQFLEALGLPSGKIRIEEVKTIEVVE